MLYELNMIQYLQYIFRMGFYALVLTRPVVTAPTAFSRIFKKSMYKYTNDATFYYEIIGHSD